MYRLITATKVEEGILQKATYKKGLDDKIIQAGLYNDDATDVDRQKKLEEILRKNNCEDESDGQEDDTEIPTDEQINVMLARSDEEMVLFNKMDEDMYELEGKAERMEEIMEQRPGLKDYSRINWRLTQDWEVPEWVKVQPINKEEEAKKSLDLGKRQRNKFVNYDNMSEIRYMQIIQDGGDPNEVMRQEVIKRENRRNRGLPSQEEPQQDADMDEDEEDQGS